MSTNLMTASRQWANRPDDERFWTLEEARNIAKAYHENSREEEVPFSSLRIQEDEQNHDDLILVGPSEKPARFNHWSFGQLARTIGAPAEYLRGLPSQLAIANLSYGISQRQKYADDSTLFNTKLLLHTNGQLTLRAINSDTYSRFWNWEVLDRMIRLKDEQGWQVPPARPSSYTGNTKIATEDDVLSSNKSGLSIKVGDTLAPAGIYVSDHDSFIFMVNEKARISDGSDTGLARGFFVSNSEVGAGSLRVTYFLYQFVCGNHIVWGARDVMELRVRHVGRVEERFEEKLSNQLTEYSNRRALEDEQRIANAKTFSLGNTKDEVLDKVFGLRIPGLSKKTLELSYRSAEENETVHLAPPTTVWGLTQGMTRISQEIQYTDERTALDRAAGKVLQMAC